VRDGLLAPLVRHASASLPIRENAGPDVTRDLGTFLGRLAPPADAPGAGWMRRTSEGPDDMPAHVKSALLPTCLQVPVPGGALRLGTWQVIFLVEHRDRPRGRRVAADFAPRRPSVRPAVAPLPPPIRKDRPHAKLLSWPRRAR